MPMKAFRLTLVLAVSPIIAVHMSYGLGVWHGHLPLCNPYWDGCLSISAAGRTPPGSFLFKPVMIAHGTLLVVLWQLVASWLRTLGTAGPLPRAIATVGGIGGLFLIIYVTFLGHPGEIYNFMRRFGVIVYFAFTALAQLLTAQAIDRCPSPLADSATAKWQTRILAGIVLLGLASIPAQHFLDVPGLDNAIEWSLALLMQFNFAILWWLQRQTNMRIRLECMSDHH